MIILKQRNCPFFKETNRATNQRLRQWFSDGINLCFIPYGFMDLSWVWAYATLPSVSCGVVALLKIVCRPMINSQLTIINEQRFFFSTTQALFLFILSHCMMSTVGCAVRKNSRHAYAIFVIVCL